MPDTTAVDNEELDALPQTPARPPKNPVQRRVEQAFVHLLGLMLIPVGRYSSLRTMRLIARGFGWMVFHLSPRRVRMATANILAAFGDKYTPRQARRICYLSVVNILTTVAEMIKLPWMSDDALRALSTIEGLEHLETARARGNGAILITAHFGNWEWGGALAAVLGFPISVVARDASDPVMRDLFNSSRESKGIKVYGRKDTRQLLRALKENECIALLPDQHAVDGAVVCKFLGRPAATHSGPAMLALRTGALIIPCFGVRCPDGRIAARLYPPLELAVTGDRQADILAITQAINDVIGEQIRAHPEQWLWLHNRWKVRQQTDDPSQ